jgi:hypothetical protein
MTKFMKRLLPQSILFLLVMAASVTAGTCDNPHCGCDDCDCVNCQCGVPRYQLVNFLPPLDDSAWGDDFAEVLEPEDKPEPVKPAVEKAEVEDAEDATVSSPLDDPKDDLIDLIDSAKETDQLAKENESRLAKALEEIGSLNAELKSKLTEDKAEPAETWNPFKDVWNDYDAGDEWKDDVVRRIEVLEKNQLTEKDVIRIVEANFAVMRISAKTGEKSTTVDITTDRMADEEITVPGFAGTFTVPKGASIEKIFMPGDSRMTAYDVNKVSAPVNYQSSVVYQATAGPYSVYATNYGQPQTQYRATVYRTAELQPYVQSTVRQPLLGRRLRTNRIINPRVSATGATCRVNADGTVSCQ